MCIASWCGGGWGCFVGLLGCLLCLWEERDEEEERERDKEELKIYIYLNEIAKKIEPLMLGVL